MTTIFAVSRFIQLNDGNALKVTTCASWVFQPSAAVCGAFAYKAPAMSAWPGFSLLPD